jgi:hypothetical protein
MGDREGTSHCRLCVVVGDAPTLNFHFPTTACKNCKQAKNLLVARQSVFKWLLWGSD